MLSICIVSIDERVQEMITLEPSELSIIEIRVLDGLVWLVMAFIFSSFVIFLWLSHKSKIKFHIPFVGRLFFPDFIWFRTLYLSTIYISLPLQTHQITMFCFVRYDNVNWLSISNSNWNAFQLFKCLHLLCVYNATL